MRERSLPTSASETSIQPAKIRSIPTRRPIAQSAELRQLGQDEDPDQQARDPAEPDQAGALLAASRDRDGDPGQPHEEEVDAEDDGQGQGPVVGLEHEPETRR